MLASGAPDNSFASFPGSGELYLAFRAHGSTTLRAIQKGAVVSIWGKKDESVDSSAAKVIFYRYDEFGVPLYESAPYYISDTLNVITLDKEYTTLTISLTEGDDGDTILGSQGFLIDAVLLLQNRDSIVKTGGVVHHDLNSKRSGILGNYPNPFIAATQHTTMLVRLDKTADVSVRIYDGIGREVGVITSGVLSSGDHSIEVSVTQPQVYLARLFLDGIPSGAPFKLTAQ
jgi:hypothetical protein